MLLYISKQLLDDDKREMLQMKMQFLPEGDLYDFGEGKAREKKFRWNKASTSAWNEAEDSDSEGEQIVTIAQPKFSAQVEDSCTSNSILISHKSNSTGLLSDFLEQDKRFFSNKRPANNQPIRPPKKSKLNDKKQLRPSIFDLLKG